MKYKLTVNLPTLHSVKEYDEDGSSEPYLWIAYISLDSRSVASSSKIRVNAPNLGLSTQSAFRDGVDDNEDVAIPPQMGEATIILDDGDNGSPLMFGVVVVLLEEDSTLLNAIVAGHEAFESSLVAQLKAFFDRHIGDSDEELALALINEPTQMIEAVQEATESAIKSYYNLIEKIGAFLFGNKDDFIGSSILTFNGIDAINANAGIEMKFPTMRKVTPPSILGIPTPFGQSHINEYQLTGGKFFIEEAKEEPCPAQVQRVNDAQRRVKDVQDLITRQQALLQHASASQKPLINKEILRLRTDVLPPAQQALITAQQALASCRAAHP